MATTDQTLPPQQTQTQQVPGQEQVQQAPPDPVRVEHNVALAQLQAAGHEVKLDTFYVVRNQWGEHRYITKDRADAELRIREMAAFGIGPAGTPVGHPEPSPIGNPGLTLEEVQAVDLPAAAQAETPMLAGGNAQPAQPSPQGSPA